VAENPYSPPQRTGISEEEALVRKAREPVRTGVFVALLVLVMVGPALFIGGWAGLVTGIIGATVLWGIYRATTRTPQGLSPAISAGGSACPKCKSMQTDQSWARGPDGGEVLVWNCFSCSHRWDAGQGKR
jgi:hypothetical protein